MTYQLQTDVSAYGRSLSSGPLLDRPHHKSWVRRLEDRPSMSGQQSSGSAWGSDQEGGDTHEAYTQLGNWMGMYNTPPPQPTQETQQDHDESLVPGRDVRPPHRYGWTPPPNAPPPRRGRRRG